jgi:hypothetical protein
MWMNTLCTDPYMKGIKYQALHFADSQVAISQSEAERQEVDFKLIRTTEEFVMRISLKDHDYNVCTRMY